MTASVRTRINGKGSGQTGMVLLLCLLLLTALTLVGLSATADAVLQSQLSANLQDQERARQSARAALSWAEQWLLGLAGAMPPACETPCDGVYLHVGGSLPVHPEREDIDWWIANGHEAGVDPVTGARLALPPSGNADPAYWLIESIHNETNANSTATNAWYRLLVRGTGRRDTAISVIEGTLVRAWPLAGNTTSSNDTNTAEGVSLNDCSPPGLTIRCGRVAWRALR